MPNVLLLHLNDVADAMVTTSLVKRMQKDGYTVDCVSNEQSEPLFEYSGGKNLTPRQAMSCSYDVAINLSPSFSGSDILEKVKANKKLGYGLDQSRIFFHNEGAKRHYETMHLGIETKSNLFQLTYAIADMTWQGEGYGICYFPRNKSKKGLTGLATKDLKLREFISSNLTLEQSRLWMIPFKKSVLKQIDETNRCKQIVTDDPLNLHVSLALRKNVEYVIPKAMPYKVETFGSGNVHIYDAELIKKVRK